MCKTTLSVWTYSARNADEYDDRRVWLGAVGSAVLATDARKAALKAGFYLMNNLGIR
jgi:hypothetical protein